MTPHLVGIAGPSCSGKSEIAHWLSGRTGAPVLNLDHYYRSFDSEPLEVRAARNFDEPASVDHDEIIRHVRALASGRAVRAPRYDFATHTRTTGGDLIEPARIVIFEGLFALYWPELRELFGTRIYVDAPDDICFERRLARDVVERGRTPDCVRRQFDATVRPMAHLHILPTRHFAHLVLSGADAIEVSGEKALNMIPD